MSKKKRVVESLAKFESDKVGANHEADFVNDHIMLFIVTIETRLSHILRAIMVTIKEDQQRQNCCSYSN